ncbi:TPA: polysaccharide deacetylase family protein, partial [Escherichia coli]
PSLSLILRYIYCLVFQGASSGGFNGKAVKVAKEAGFHLAVTTMKGKVKPGDNPLLLKRLYILRTDSLETMSRLVSNQPQG